MSLGVVRDIKKFKKNLKVIAVCVEPVLTEGPCGNHHNLIGDSCKINRTKKFSFTNR